MQASGQKARARSLELLRAPRSFTLSRGERPCIGSAGGILSLLWTRINPLPSDLLRLRLQQLAGAADALLQRQRAVADRVMGDKAFAERRFHPIAQRARQRDAR